MTDLNKTIKGLLDAITTDLENDDLDNTSVLNKITQHIDGAFASIEKEEQKKLYKKLALIFHPDKMKQTQPKLYEILEKRNLLETEANPDTQKRNLHDEIFKIISGRNEPDDLFNSLKSDPVKAGKAFVEKIWAKSSYHLPLYKRYYQPFRSLTNIISWTINIALVLAEIAVILSFVTCLILMSLVRNGNDFILDLITAGQLSKTIEKYKLESISDDSLGILTELRLQFLSVVNGITAPLPEGLFSMIGSIFIARPLTILLAPIFLAVTAAVGLVEDLNIYFLLAASFTLVGIKLATLAILNAPIYTLDLVRMATSKWNASSTSEKPAQEKEANSSPRLLIEYMPPSPQPCVDRSSEPPLPGGNSLFSCATSTTDFADKGDLYRFDFK
ncbi:hypothetical protein OQJ26_16030 [Legionella sp. PATHC038]|uniref:hypothetical protein n=1 Tax=Legionella sheltonii TaxID=2992041 RepID=UPI002242D3DC|nr:hypothetical protein [Legionella sp. PATHC038]MCW8400291.1 hypothetical protein [Legionella sp. PATHC038]